MCPAALHELALESDGDHFTREAHVLFAEALASALVEAGVERGSSLAIVSDSTIDWHNYEGDDWQWTGWASDEVTIALRTRGIDAVIDAVCGSGFAARASTNDHFFPRLSRMLARARQITCCSGEGGTMPTTARRAPRRTRRDRRARAARSPQQARAHEKRRCATSVGTATF